MRWNHPLVEQAPALIGTKLLYLKEVEHLYPRRNRSRERFYLSG
jgi:hypothetical protein